ncbi:hydroxyisourate hydrolase [Nocardia yamanashiensis]|uniref:hydroxyisourate hydrolase n=1 Tax=Nocardia yamanashiensis TaxID=209247 RepID=UPI001E47936E|nr:hydroxyisourate hydrolase [Nocardia yamanashiensis]UGT43308.1 hydroxyisourate hydrolase [Nocardia yamanashiensis]
MSALTTHVLDTALGRPAAGVAVRLQRAADGRIEPDPEVCMAQAAPLLEQLGARLAGSRHFAELSRNSK